jgi:hypothetical protein
MRYLSFKGEYIQVCITMTCLLTTNFAYSGKIYDPLICIKQVHTMHTLFLTLTTIVITDYYATLKPYQGCKTLENHIYRITFKFIHNIIIDIFIFSLKLFPSIVF